MLLRVTKLIMELAIPQLRKVSEGRLPSFSKTANQTETIPYTGPITRY